jgi:hypothetical protein
MLSDEEQAIVDSVRDFVDRQVRPVVRDIEHRLAARRPGRTVTVRPDAASTILARELRVAIIRGRYNDLRDV